MSMVFGLHRNECTSQMRVGDTTYRVQRSLQAGGRQTVETVHGPAPNRIFGRPKILGSLV